MANTHSIDFESGSTQFSYILDGSQTGLDLSTALTLEAYVKAESLTSARTIISKYLTTGNQRSYVWAIKTDGGFQFNVSSDGTSTATGQFQVYESNAGSHVTTGNWIHTAITFDLSTETCVMYVNGSSISSSKTVGTTLGANLFNSNADFMIGAQESNSSPSAPMDGLMNNVRVWSVVRSGTQINDNKDIVLTSGTGLQGAWYNQNTHNGQTANGNNLTASGSPIFSTDVPFSTPTTGGYYFMSY